VSVTDQSWVHDIAVVVPVYQGEGTLPALVEELLPLVGGEVTPDGHHYAVTEIILVHDCGPDRSDRTIQELAEQHQVVSPVWLSRNFGQHPATIAGIASSAATWVATLDEDGQHLPSDIGVLLDAALRERARLVYGQHDRHAPHPAWRNLASAVARRLAKFIAGSDLKTFSSFRLIAGTHARSVAAYCGPRIYLDIALTWAIGTTATAVVSTRPEWREGSGYSVHRLLSHFWTLVLTGGTRPLRIVSAMGILVSITGVLGAIWIAIARLRYGFDSPGWASVIVTLLLASGMILFVLGVIAEYIGALLLAAQGRPLYIVVDDPRSGPFDRA
jgi:glycosyltransferase involved in cell wall biosynthesis